MHHSVRRAAALVAVPALTLAALAVTSGPASAVDTDLNPGIAAANWLSMQPVDGVVSYDSGGFAYNDFGGSIDLARFLQLAGGHEDTVGDISDALATRLGEYITGGEFDAGSTYVGPVAKAAVLAESTADVTDFGGVDLIDRLQDQVTPDGLAVGRVFDTSMYGDYANVFGQSFAAQALAEAESTDTGAVTDYLLAQQCADGGFKESLPAADAETQNCAAASGAESIDATATAVMSLWSQNDDLDVHGVITSAVAWLEDQQLASGAFSTGGDFGANANSTGLATSALALVAQGATPAVTNGAIWVRQHQVHFQDACGSIAPSDSGAIAYNDADRAAGLKDGITSAKYGKWFQATAQAAAALLWAPKGDGANVLFTAEYVKAGGTKPVGVTGADPGEQLCAVAGGSKVVRWADANGEADLPVAISSKTAKTKVLVYDVESKIGAASINALGAKKLSVSLKGSVRKGKTQTVKVTGLAPAESVKVKLFGTSKRGQANDQGVFVARAKATGKPGRAKVTVTGEFANRTGSKTFKVVR